MTEQCPCRQCFTQATYQRFTWWISIRSSILSPWFLPSPVQSQVLPLWALCFESTNTILSEFASWLDPLKNWPCFTCWLVHWRTHHICSHTRSHPCPLAGSSQICHVLHANWLTLQYPSLPLPQNKLNSPCITHPLTTYDRQILCITTGYTDTYPLVAPAHSTAHQHITSFYYRS